MKVEIDHAAYQRKVRKMSELSLKFIIKDATEAINANPDGPKAGYYADEINYCCDELHRRRQLPWDLRTLNGGLSVTDLRGNFIDDSE
jgi:hypothetical protein